MSKQGRVLVAMSGGIDSSLTAVMLHEQGYEVIGMTLKTWDYATSGGSKKETGCCSLDSINDARNIAVGLGFPHYILDIREEFGDAVIDYFTGEYIAGRTPNPCVMCNTHIKWEALIKRADKLNCEYIATGHYASVRYNNGRYIVSKGIDELKDQSYVLWGVSQENLARTLLPLGTYRKTQIKQMAKEKGFFDLINKPESYEICFVPDNDYRSFLKRRYPKLENEVKGGNFITSDGKILGQHEGYPFYTVGQRKGLGVALGYPAFVTEIRKHSNEVVLGTAEGLERNGMWVSKLNLQKYSHLPQPIEAVTKIRYKDQGTESQLVQTDSDRIEVRFYTKVNAIAPGQAAVFYEGDDMIGGGWIDASFEV
ncbi:MAG: tRNA 2-thiouridine(34) synthase MnmA [Cytophagales bacterium]|nr:tRNA 2-thiouridine(34) synthase MnmA [Cytophagales bacterium]